MDHVRGGTLQNRIRTQFPGPGLPPDTIKDFAFQILSGLAFMHSNRIIHRDLKDNNILITQDNVLKIADFGISKSFTPNQSSLYQSQDCGNVFWRAPELIRGEGGGRRADVWSLGLLVYRMATGNHLFDCERPQLALAIKDLKPEDIDLELRDWVLLTDIFTLIYRTLTAHRKMQWFSTHSHWSVWTTPIRLRGPLFDDIHADCHTTQTLRPGVDRAVFCGTRYGTV
eukprot:sb/3469603/